MRDLILAMEGSYIAGTEGLAQLEAKKLITVTYNEERIGKPPTEIMKVTVIVGGDFGNFTAIA